MSRRLDEKGDVASWIITGVSYCIMASQAYGKTAAVSVYTAFGALAMLACFYLYTRSTFDE